MRVISTAGLARRAPRPEMSRRLLLVLAVLVVGALLPGSAAAEPQRGQLVVQGVGGTSSVLDLPRNVPLRSPFPELVGGGPYAAVLLEPIDGRPGRTRVVGAVQVRAFADSTAKPVALLGAEGELLAGRYRVTLLGEGLVRAAYPMADDQAAGVVLAPRHRIAHQFLGRAENLPAGLSSARVDLPGAAPAGTRVIQVGLGDGVSADDYRMCVTTAAQCGTRLLLLCPPLGGPCPQDEVPVPRPSVTYQPTIRAVLHSAEPVRRALRWSVQGYRQSPGRLRAAAILF